MTDYSTWALLDLIKEQQKCQDILDQNPLNQVAAMKWLRIERELANRPDIQD